MSPRESSSWRRGGSSSTAARRNSSAARETRGPRRSWIAYSRKNERRKRTGAHEAARQRMPPRRIRAAPTDERRASSMRVARLDTRIVDIPVQSPYVFSHGVLKAFSNVLVWIHADGGAV